MKEFESLGGYVEALQRKGQYSFAKTDAAKVLKVSEAALKLSLHRLSLKHRIAQVRRGFYIIVPIEYSMNGILPADWFIDELHEVYPAALLRRVAVGCSVPRYRASTTAGIPGRMSGFAAPHSDSQTSNQVLQEEGYGELSAYAS